MNDDSILEEPHRKVIELLPWYANGTLDDTERSFVEAHLADCTACGDELGLERDIMAARPAATRLADVDVARVDAGWTAMLSLIRDDEPSHASAPASEYAGNVVPLPSRSFWRRPVPMGWVIAAQAAAVVLMVGGTQIWRRSAPAGQYRALSSDLRATDADLLVMFRADMSEQDLRRILLSNQATIVGGPNANGAYQLSIARPQLHTAIQRLRADARVTMAQPIDGGGQ